MRANVAVLPGVLAGELEVSRQLADCGERPIRSASEPGSLASRPMSKKTAKRRAKARRKKANHRRKPNAR